MSRRIDPRRIQFAEQLLAVGSPSGQAQQQLMQKFNVRPTSAREYLRRAWAAIAAADAEDAPRRKVRHRRTLQFMLQRALAKNDMHACAKFCDQLAKLDGAYAPVRLEAAIATGPAGMTSDARAARIAEIVLGENRRVLTLVRGPGEPEYPGGPANVGTGGPEE